MKRNYNLHALDIIAYVFPSSPPPEGVTWRAFQIVARDPARDLARWCSATIQATAEVLRYEVDLDLGIGLLSDAGRDAAHEWAGDLELALQAEDSEHQLWFDRRYFDDRPHAVVEVEVDFDDIEGMDLEGAEVSRLLFDQMAEDETGNPTCVPRPARKEKA